MPPPPPPPPPPSGHGMGRGSRGHGSRQPRTAQRHPQAAGGGQWDFQDSTQSGHILTAF